MILSLVAFVIRLALVGAMTFCFVVLFEHGPSHYLQNFQTDFAKFLEFTNPSTPPSAKKSSDGGLDESAKER